MTRTDTVYLKSVQRAYNLSDKAIEIWDKIGRGSRLRIELGKDKDFASLVDLYIDKMIVACDDSAALEVIPHLHKLTKLGIPPIDERKKYEGYRAGWLEMGLDGDAYYWYCMVQ